jgi:hypothetical protein
MNQLITASFSEIAQLITAAMQRAVQAVNTSLIELYWISARSSAKKLLLPSGETAWWISWRHIWRKLSRD